MSTKDKYAFIGLGVTKQGRGLGLTSHELAVQAGLLAMADAGLKKSEVNGFISQQSFAGGHSPDIVRDMGISTKIVWQIYGIGTHGVGIFLCALGALEAGICDTVMVLYSTAASTQNVLVGESKSNPSMEGAYGLYGPASRVAGWTRRFMHEYGLTEKHLGKIAVTLRDYANQRPEAAMYNKKLTLEDYFASRYIAEPIRARDCCMVNDGACALIITTAEKAKSLKRNPVYIMAYGQDYSLGKAAISPEAVFELNGAQQLKLAHEVYGKAGIEVKDIDVAQFYDAFTVNIVDQLSGYGFCKRGEEGPFIEDGNIGLHGTIPCNTSGTEQSWSYLHSWSHFAEAVRQLRGEAGACQVKGAEVCLVTGGLSAIDSGTSSACFVLRR
jgi:acetyl-CoA acetyltransferase